ncbi:hypothetical protein [Actinomadura sediminis]|uniref:Uncharacterized protein n=1 Tax=Actinomadura sediminis TaxID=1038904 RepID=A0ABW3EG13_9ACTN
MGCEPEETAATQFVHSMGVLPADPGKVPNFSLPEGGNQTLTDVLAEDLGARLHALAHGTEAQRQRWLRPVAEGGLVGAFAAGAPSTSRRPSGTTPARPSAASASSAS